MMLEVREPEVEWTLTTLGDREQMRLRLESNFGLFLVLRGSLVEGVPYRGSQDVELTGWVEKDGEQRILLLLGWLSPADSLVAAEELAWQRARLTSDLEQACRELLDPVLAILVAAELTTLVLRLVDAEVQAWAPSAAAIPLLPA